MDRTSAFAKALRQHRGERRLTQQELAERAHLSERAISDLERGLKIPQRATVRLLIGALALSADQAEQFEVAARSRARGIDGVAYGVTKDELREVLEREQDAVVQRLTNIPIQRQRLIGRARDVDALCQAIVRDDGCSLTLVGPGGVGKTRLALEAGARLLEAHVDGVWLIDLAAVTEVDLVVPTVATALGVRVELDCEPAATLLGYLANRKLLLVLDNCEHLVEACADMVGAVRQHCASVRVLATSREPLGIDSEVVWRLRPLEEQDAALLFVDRARAQHPTVLVDDAAAVALLCRRLDGLPLAIELAAARVSVLGPSEMLRHLEDRFALLRRTGRATSLRHQTLRATVDWSYELLDAAEQQLFRRLAVYVGSFDLSAAEAMGGPGALDRLGRLIDKSLVLAAPGPLGTRYRLLETLREYAWERLREADDVELARSRHLAYFLGRAEALYAPTQGLAGPLRALDGDLDNLRSAFDWCELADAAAGLRLIAATGYLWWRRSCAEGRRWADLFLARCPEPSLARAEALHAAGALEMFWDPLRSRQLEVEATALAEQLGDRATAAIAMALAGYSAVLEENAEEAIPVLERSLTLVEGLGDTRGVAWVLIILAGALITSHERREEGRQRIERALAMAAAAGEGGDQAVPSFGHFLLGLYWRWRGVPGRALDHFRRALALQGDLQMVPNLSSVLLQVARLLAASEPLRAARLAGAGLAFAEQAGVRFPPRYRLAAERLQDELERRLGQAPVQQAWSDGGRLSSDEAIALALVVSPGSRAAPGGLSTREREVAKLVARGLSSRHIAESLQLSTRTVDNHLARIFTKLGVSGRVQLAAWLLQAPAEFPTAD